jgi:hypothetical protein
MASGSTVDPATSGGLPPLSPGDDHELRVHGVAGTSPESMLGLAARLHATGVAGTGGGDKPDVRRGESGAETPCVADPAPGDVSVWEPPEVDARLRAYSWSSLTSGHWYQAFYLVLLPFMLANLAGWMIIGRSPLGRPWEVRLAAFSVRAVGLLITAVFVVSAQILVADLVVFQWLRWPVALGPPATAAVLVGTVVLTRIRQPRGNAPAPWRNDDDPVGQCSLGVQERMWASPGINVTLRWLHLDAGLGLIAVLAAWPGGLAPDWAGRLALVLGGLVDVVAVALLAWVSLAAGSQGMRPTMAIVRPLSAVAGLAVAAAVVHQVGLPNGTLRPGTPLPALHGAIVWIALAVLVGVVLLATVGLVARGGRSAFNAPAVLLLAASLGAMLGAGVGGQVVRQTGICSVSCSLVGAYVAWLAVGATAAIAVLIAVVLGVLLWLWRHPDGTWSVSHRLTGSAGWFTVVLLGTGVLLLVAGLVMASREGTVPAMPPMMIGVAQFVVEALIVVPVLAGVVRLVWRVPAASTRRANLPPARAAWVGRIAGFVTLALLVWIAVGTEWTITVLGVPLPPRTFTDFALDVALLLPTTAVLARIYSGLNNRGVRRGVGVLWDVGTFWPRWFHPFAPPTYSDSAVPKLVDQIQADLAAGHRLVLAPHSQGAVIAATAVLGVRRSQRLAMLSYGSPWNHLYAQFFPLYVNAATTKEVIDRLGGPDGVRWRNLCRATDPIGGPIDGVPGQDPLPDPCHRGHSDYWVEPQYAEAMVQLRGLLSSSAGVADGRTEIIEAERVPVELIRLPDVPGAAGRLP